MTYYPDLTKYDYFDDEDAPPGTKNVGWLDAGHDFTRSAPSDALLDRLWQFCKVSTAQTRGLHACELCPDGAAHQTRRHGELLQLGSSEIRVFGAGGEIYAAPTMIYHYVADHSYAPPAEFLEAVEHGLAPPDPAYFARLTELGISWRPTSAGSSSGRRYLFPPRKP